MLKKLTVIKNLGTFSNFKPSKNGSEWNGTFKKNNIVFAHNGSGKTTLSLIFQSIANSDNDLINKKHRITSSDDVEVHFLGDTENYNFVNGSWDNFNTNIKVFNSFYFRDNVYAFKFSNDEFSYIFKSNQEINKLNAELSKYLEDMSKIRKQIKRNPSWTKEQLKRAKTKGEKKQITSRNKKFRGEKREELSQLDKRVREIAPRVKDFYQSICKEYCNKVNYYLNQFTESIVIKDIKPIYDNFVNLKSIVFNLEIDGVQTQLGNRNISFDFFLSDGDKNSLAFASFLARLDMMGSDYLTKQIIILDDPFSSMDSNRKNRTISLISRLSQRVQQLFIFSHDLYFANDLDNRFYPKDSILCLEMNKYNGETHFLVKENFKLETKTMLIQRIEKLHSFEKNGAPSDKLVSIKNDIRPILEGMFKIKFYKTLLDLKDKEQINIDQLWLKNYIDYIEKSKEDERYQEFSRLYENLSTLRDLQNFCSPPHHDQSDTSYNQVIDQFDLKVYVRDTLEMIQLI